MSDFVLLTNLLVIEFSSLCPFPFFFFYFLPLFRVTWPTVCPPLLTSVLHFIPVWMRNLSFFVLFCFSLCPLCLLPPGDAFPWTVSLSQFSVYTLLGQQRSLSLVEPMGCTSTLAVTSHKLQADSEGRHSFVVCLHVDLQPIHIKCSNPQVSETHLHLAKVVTRFTCVFIQIMLL